MHDLYQELILDHGKRPRNLRSIAGTDQKAEGFNPLCGDRVTVFIDLEDDVIADISFQGTACAICTASASMMTKQLRGATAEEARSIFADFIAMLTAPNGDPPDRLGKLASLAGVRKYPMRVKCATLPWHTMREALERTGRTASTE